MVQGCSQKGSDDLKGELEQPVKRAREGEGEAGLGLGWGLDCGGVCEGSDGEGGTVYEQGETEVGMEEVCIAKGLVLEAARLVWSGEDGFGLSIVNLSERVSDPVLTGLVEEFEGLCFTAVLSTETISVSVRLEGNPRATGATVIEVVDRESLGAVKIGGERAGY
ncbi:hypothetical protein F2Q68_00015352 [Brassica cretica]|uniref:Uncharacterized protein n=1 Tax=Brassica cretica TaxID=69181 RepID=A0A8S9HSE7_BRACR|nr:hypothetical protein F2Q68_00015352 [Brassica cretica]